MAQQNISLDEPPVSPTKSLWKRLMTRSSSAHCEQTGHGVSPDVESAVPLPMLQTPDLASHPDATRDSTERHDVPGDGAVVASKSGGPGRRSQWDVVPNLPRAQTLARQQSELRANLLEVMPTPAERRAASVDRRLSRSASTPTRSHIFSNPRSSAPCISHLQEPRSRGASVPRPITLSRSIPPVPPLPKSNLSNERAVSADSIPKEEQIPDPDKVAASSDERFTFAEEDGQHAEILEHEVHADDLLKEPYLIDTNSMTSTEYEQRIRYELENIWILNLSMHFRDRSRREKFFVTYRQRPDLSRRVTVSLDYRNAPEGSLEMDLMNTKVQRDKNEMIYEAIRESLIDIQFYDTVTNLKLQTTDGRLHVHVVEDVTEIIDYPSGHYVHHLGCRKIRERDVEFESHMSGFVYKVRVDGKTLIKKEIPGPDSVDEFLYEVNALNFLRGSHNVIELYGVVIGDDDRVKGLLISYAAQGALIDILYESNHGLPWHTRLKWARQIVHGLSEVHEAGFVQGDFTLSNIVIDDYGDAKIIDINRRGCPVGWEPPEATPLIQSEQRISMYIGVKSDLYQLGMVLWALATQYDDPEAHGRPLFLNDTIGAPRWYREVVETCLADDPRLRVQARQLLGYFPSPSSRSGHPDDSDCDDWVDGPHHPAFYAHSAPSESLDDGKGSSRHRAGIESAASSEYHPDVIEHLPPGNDDHSTDKFARISPRIKSGTPSNEWSYVNFGHTYVDPLSGVSNEPYYYPTRGRSPPRPLRADTLPDSTQREHSWTRTRSSEKQSLPPPPVRQEDDLEIAGNLMPEGVEEPADQVSSAHEAVGGSQTESEASSQPIESTAAIPTSKFTKEQPDRTLPTTTTESTPAKSDSEHQESPITQQGSDTEVATDNENGFEINDAACGSASAGVVEPVSVLDVPPPAQGTASLLPGRGCAVDDGLCDDSHILDETNNYALGTESLMPAFMDRHDDKKMEPHDYQHVDAGNAIPALVTT